MPGIEESGNSQTFCLADGSSVVLSAAEVKGLVEMLQAMEAGMQASNAESLQQTDGAGATTGQTAETAQTPEEQVKSLLIGLLNMLVTKKGEGESGDGKKGLTAEGQKMLSAALQSLGIWVDSEGKMEESAETESSADSTDKAPDVDDKATLEMLALLIFSSLQALAQKQNEESVSPDTLGQFSSSTTPASDVPDNTQPVFVPEAPRASATAAGASKDDNHPKVNPNDNVDSFLENLADTGSDIRLTPSVQEDAVKNLTLTITRLSRRTDQESEPLQASPEVVAGMTAIETTQPGAVDVGAEGAAIVADLSPLLEGKEDDRSGEGAGDKNSSSNDGQYQFAGNNNVSKTTGQETKAAAADRPASAGTLERFERVFEQISSKASSHDLTVRLDIGNKESLLLGFKDMGQGISVEVKASHQAITDLLQSQKDAIMKHLESKDVHATIQIDPDASAQDRRDRRESKDLQRNPFAKNEETEGFGEYLEIFA